MKYLLPVILCSLLSNISLTAGDEIYVRVHAGNFVGLNLTIGQYALAKDFSNENNPNGPWAYGQHSPWGRHLSSRG